ncbi:TonB-dependent receptor [Lutibacter sp. HS1-25]|uniref:TonB-dependent receptor n=1 Tax=Lutibacter sp. HS1-25 TaxID=2485000 RepID=UPI001012B1C0|nr:TonB-dependent receptor [Lutibacter sp. HS1-25]RXP60341.1 TonB-dependent receptor [Lutibacter sp. HS1-25]
MKKYTLIFLLFAIPFWVYGQKVTVEGIVKDAAGKPLEMANVIAFKKGTNFLESYSITDTKGHYKLHLEESLAYTIKVNYLGYEPKIIDITVAIASADLKQDIVLNEASETLNEVEISYEIPIKISGDTISYNTDSFTNGTEKKLEDVLAKLPGIDIDDNGEVEVEGKKVNKVLVEGKEFFDGDSKLATQNIPANAIDKVQVLKNYNEVAGMRGVTNNEDNIALNIKLKKGKDKFWFGEVNAGGGVSEGNAKYIAKPKLFYYSPTRSVNILADFNNIGETPFTRQDYFRFTGGLRGGMSNNGTNFNVTSSGLGFLTTQNNRALEIVSNFGALNFGLTPKKELTITGFGIVNNSQTEMLTESQIVYNKTGLIDVSETTSTQESKLGLLKFGVTYKPNDDLHLDYDIFGKLSNQNELVEVNSTQRSADTYKKEEPVSINQNFNAYYNVNKNNILAVELQYIFEKDKPLLNAITSTQPFSFIPSIDQELYDMTQYKKFNTSKFDGKIDYYYLLNQKSNINLSFGSTLSSQNYETSISQFLDNGTEINFAEQTLNNDVKFNFTDLFVGVYYKIVEGIFTFNPGVTIHNYQIKDEQLATVDTENLTKILPDVYARLQFKTSESLRFNYSISSQFTDINDAAEGFIYSNYRAMYKGNRDLENSLNHRYSLSYFSFSMFNFTNINAALNYTKKVNVIKNRTLLVGVDRVSSPVNSEFADETFSGNFRYGKTYSKLKTNFSASFNNSIFNNIVNNEEIKSKEFSHNYQASVATKFKNAPNFEVGYQLSFRKYLSNGSTTNRPFANMEIVFLKNFILTADYSYYNYQDKDKTYKNEYSFLNANLYYQKQKSKWEFKITANNITNNASINTDSYNEVNDSNTSALYFIQPRLWLFSVKYNL